MLKAKAIKAAAAALICAAVGLFVCSGVAASADSSYIRGDADGNGVVDVRDVTAVQRLLAGTEPDPDGTKAMRGDVNGNGLNIEDATQLQAYLAEFGNAYGIGEIVTVEVTESTQASTGFTLGEDDLPFIWN